MTMHRNQLSFVLLLTLLGCAAPGPELQVRPQAASAPEPAQDRLAHAASLYARGEYALAIEAYRKTIRYEPRNAAAQAGLAASYDRIGRFDLADRYFQLALAIDPRNPRLASIYAQALERHGYMQQAADVLRLASADASGARVATATEAAGASEAEPGAPSIASGTSVTIALEPRPVPAPDRPRPAATPRMQLERVSLAEVALVTRPEPRRHDAVASIARGSSVRIALDDPVDLSKSPTRGLRVLNGVGRRGQAARMRAHLQGRGWQPITVGDAAHRLPNSQLLAPARWTGQARLLAGQLPFRVSVVRSPEQSAMVLVLGANSVGFDDRLKAARN